MKSSTCWLLFILAFQIGVAQDSESLDVRLFRSINNQQSRGDGIFEILDKTTIPTFAAIPAGFFLVDAFGGDKSNSDTGVLMGLSQALTLGGTFAVKTVVDRQRPFESLADVKVKHLSSATGSSFPSGHTSQAFAIATTLALTYSKPIVYIPAFLWAGLVGYGRVYLGVHYPSDVLVGAVLGTGCALLVWSYKDDIIRLKDKVVGSSDSNVDIQVAPFAGGKLFQVQICFN